jgi:predicted dehydrogenase
MAKIVLIGAGRMGHRFSQAIRQSKHDLAMIFDPGETPWAIAIEPELAAVHSRDFADVLASDAQAYAICTTADHHASTASKLIEAGKKHLIIEKPLSQSVQEGIELRKLADAHGARVIVNHGRRYSTNTQAIKDLISDPRTGALRSVVIKMGGGSFGCVGTHWIDLCNNLLGGLPDRVFGELSGETPPDNRGSQFFDPGGTAILMYPGGKRAIIDLGDDVGIVASTEFIFEKGIVAWTTEAGTWTFRHRRPEDQDKSLTLYGLPLVETPFEAAPPDLIAYAMATIEDVFAQTPTQSGLDQAIDTMEVFAAIHCSAREGRAIKLPLPDAEKQIIYAIP